MLRFLPHSEPGAVRGIHERVVGQAGELGVQRVVEHARQLLGAPAERAAQVGAADVADEQRVAGEHRVGVGGPRSGSYTRIEIDSGECPGVSSTSSRTAPSCDGIAVGHRRERVLGLGPRAKVDRRALALAKLEVAGHEVGVEVRQEHVLDPAAQPPGVLEVLLDVALRIDHGRVAARLVGDQVGGVREAAEVVLLEDHEVVRVAERPGQP